MSVMRYQKKNIELAAYEAVDHITDIRPTFILSKRK